MTDPTAVASWERGNAILFIVDSLRRDAIGPYGPPWVDTPTFDRLAERGTVFDQAYIGSFPCMPARRDIWTGRFEFPWRGWGPLEEGEPTLPGILSEAGVVTQLVTDHYHFWERGAGNYHFDFDGAELIRGQENDHWMAFGERQVELPVEGAKLAGHARFPDSYQRYLHNTAGRSEEADYFAPRVMQGAIDWLRREGPESPFFLVVDCFDPHEPFDPPPDYARPYLPPGDAPANPWPTYGTSDRFSPEEMEAIKALYAGEVALVDRWMGRVLDTLDELALTDSTLIMVVSDHGHLFGEHGLIGKPWTGLGDPNLYDELARIPFLVVDPTRSRPGERRQELVQPVDVLATVLDWFGVPPPPDVHGSSLLALLGEEEAAPWRSYAFFGRFGESIDVTDGRWTLFRWPEGTDNSPLYWYSALPPTFIGARAAGELEEGPRYPAVVARGEWATALFERRPDGTSREVAVADEPEVVDRLEGAIVSFLSDIGAPPEQFRRLGLPAPVSRP